MKKLLLLTTILLGLAGCGTDSATSKTDSTKKIESSTSQSSSIKSTTTTKQSTEATTAQTKTSAAASTSASEGKVSEADFKELLSGVEYNKDYLTEDQVAELKEMHKSDLTEKQHQELLKVLGE
ncbi:hypothetical protein JZO81_11525 [Enterococcus hulanensis]|uniref:hypothetical protein n=1 Tax=Enterococcus TaxID=1350 RepID=UPI000B5A2C57|nr:MULTISPECIES: hypothetical protein [Enterococcus]MBO0411693.1 hypothetical protein [Enterococcus hulanensis]OTO18890.1 hypothetical protein A5875_000220 [Enterococcus sp. 3H8_DIV0648]